MRFDRLMTDDSYFLFVYLTPTLFKGQTEKKSMEDVACFVIVEEDKKR